MIGHKSSPCFRTAVLSRSVFLLLVLLAFHVPPAPPPPPPPPPAPSSLASTLGRIPPGPMRQAKAKEKEQCEKLGGRVGAGAEGGEAEDL